MLGKRLSEEQLQQQQEEQQEEDRESIKTLPDQLGKLLEFGSSEEDEA